MKYIASFILLFSCFRLTGQEDYTININDTTLKISLDKRYELIVNGKKLVFLVSSNDTLAYDDNLISFRYPKGFNVSRTKIEEGIEQIMITPVVRLVIARMGHQHQGFEKPGRVREVPFGRARIRHRLDALVLRP